MVKELKKQDVDVLNKGISVVKFWAPWCGFCNKFAPTYDEVASEMKAKVTFYKVNIDDEKEFATAHGVRGVPTMKVFIEGKVVDTFSGAQKKEDFKAKIEKHC